MPIKIGIAGLPPSFFQERMPVFRIEERLGHGIVGPGFDLGVEAFDFVVEIVGHRIDGHADGKIRCAAESFSSPVGALVQSIQRPFTRPTESTS